MATIRLIVVLLVLGAVLLLGVQNLAPTLPLVFFGGTTQALPLGIWLAGAVGLGALTTLVLTALLGSIGPSGGNRSTAYKYRPQSFYEPTGSGPGGSTSTQAGRNAPPPYTAPGSRSGGAGRSPSTPGTSSDDSADDDPSWRAWTSLKSPGHWSDWESLSQAPKPETTPSSSSASGIVDSVTTWFSSSKQQAKQQQRVNESLRDLDTDWDELENRPYQAPGVSPVEDHLDDITQGWEQAGDPNRDPNRDTNRHFEASQAPRRVYRDGSLYSYSYRDEGDPAPQSGQVDNIYAPPDDVIYGNDPDLQYADTAYARGSVYAADDSAYSSDEEENNNDLGEPEMAEDGVVDADYRVIVPPYTAAAEAAATAETWPDGSEDAPARPPTDEWDDADDALTP